MYTWVVFIVQLSLLILEHFYHRPPPKEISFLVTGQHPSFLQHLATINLPFVQGFAHSGHFVQMYKH